MNMVFERSAQGLRDALMSEMEDIRAGIASATEATAFALLAKTIVASLEMEITERIRVDAKEERALRRKDEQERILRLASDRKQNLQLEYVSSEYEDEAE